MSRVQTLENSGFRPSTAIDDSELKAIGRERGEGFPLAGEAFYDVSTGV